MNKSLFYLALFLLVGCTENSQPSKKTSKVQSVSKNTVVFEKTQSEYDTLIPLFDGLFLTFDDADTTAGFWQIRSEDKKWGVIDSTGKIIVPFICDGVIATEEHTGIASVFGNALSLNTGVPRYSYSGMYFTFTKDGGDHKNVKSWTRTITHVADRHKNEFIFTLGPAYFVPEID